MKKKAPGRRVKPPELRGRALAVLVRELGHADAVRFMLMHDRGRGDYTRDRHKILPNMTVDELIREADAIVKRQARAGGAARRRRSA